MNETDDQRAVVNARMSAVTSATVFSKVTYLAAVSRLRSMPRAVTK